AATRYPGMVAVHLDAHTDSYGYNPNDKYNAATQFTHAAEEQCIVASLSYHIGIRGTTYVQGVLEQTKSLGYNIISLRELFARGFADVLTELHEKLKGRPVYLCFDMDVFIRPAPRASQRRAGAACRRAKASSSCAVFPVSTLLRST
ncbi:MAG: arginase family protein, partial [Stellaceae bacterium]